MSTYAQAVEAYIQGNTRFLQDYLKSAEASQTEKNLIRARQAGQTGDLESALSILEKIHPENALLKGDKHFVTANILSYKSQWQAALIEAHQALISYLHSKHTRGLFLANYNISVYYNRLGLDDISLFHIKESEKHATNASQSSLVHRAMACYHARLCQMPDAIMQIEKALALKDALDDVDQTGVNMVAADIYFRDGQTDFALRYMNELSHSKVARDKARIRFELTVLRAMFANSQRLVDGMVPEVVVENEEYTLRWRVLESLQSGDWTVANQRWNELCQLFPQRFSAGFKCLNASDEKTIFITAIRHLMNVPTLEQTIHLSGKPRKLFDTLREAPIALRKEELIEKVWGLRYDPALDARFYKLVERLRKDSGVHIEHVNHTYRLASERVVSLSDIG